MTLAPGARVEPFEILEPLGAGGMAEVYRERDSRLGRIVAIKVLRLEAGVAESTSYVAMEWVDGLPLRDLVTR